MTADRDSLAAQEALAALEALVARVVNAQLTRKHRDRASMPWISAETVRREVLLRNDCPEHVPAAALERLAYAELKKRGLSSRKRFEEPS